MVRVLKFGGSSVATIEKLQEIASYLEKRIKGGEKLIVVVSAMGDETNRLLELASKLSDTKNNSRELDALLATGEIRTISLLSLAMQSLGVQAVSLTARQVGIKTLGDYQSAKIQGIDKELIQNKLNEYDCLIVAGFQGINEKDEIVTLGRGGSDTSAVAIAAVLGVDCEIYTDVYGIYATDPRLYENAKKIDYISYEEMNELASLGAGVMHNRSIMIAKKYNICIYVGKTLSKKKGTYIMNKDMIEQNVITALTVQKDVISTSIRFKSEVNLEETIMDMLTQNKINVDMISQVYFESETNLAFTCDIVDREKLQKVIEQLEENESIRSIQTKIYNKVSLVGSGMRDAYGVVGRVFKILKDKGITSYQVTTSEISISLLIKEERLSDAIDGLMKEFDLEETC